MAKVLLIGTGSIGSIYAYFLTQAGCCVTTVCRSNYEAVSTNGIHILSKTLGDVSLVPHRVIRKLAELEAGEFFDYIVITTKSVNESALIQDIAESSTVTKGASIVLIQNGIGIEEPYKLAFPNCQMVSGVVYLPCAQSSPGIVKMNGPDVLELGLYPACPPSKELLRFNDLLSSGGANSTVHEDVQMYRWKKALINAVWNPIAALTLSRDSDFLGSHEEAYVLCKSLMSEVLSVAHAEGHLALSEKDIDIQLARAVQRKNDGNGIKMSMLVDIEANRQMETEAILGNLVRRAAELGVEVGGLKLLYLLINGREVQRRRTTDID